MSTVIAQHRRGREAVELVHTWQKALGEGDLTAALGMLASDIVVNVPSSLPHGGVWQGREGFQQMLGTFRATWEFEEPLEFKLRDAGDDIVVVNATGRVRSRATGREAIISTAEFLTVTDATISRIDVYYADVAAVVAAVFKVEA